MIPARILIIDDNSQILESTRLLLKDEFEQIDTLPKPGRIPELLWKNNYDIILLDMNFVKGDTSGNEGIFWLNEIKKADPLLPIILITAYGDIELAVRAIQEGATDFITKPWDPEKLIISLKNVYNLRHSKLEVRKLKNKQKQLSEDLDKKFQIFKASSQIMLDVMNKVGKVAQTDANVLIVGENGTGKELIAREIHRLSTRKDNTFIGVDVASLSEGLFESEMFGHVKGAFTDAKEDRAGRFENANEGTLFLDEIGNIPINLQAKLLSAIQNREIVRVGGSKAIQVDIRLLSATNMPLNQMIEEKKFREDLFYRLNTVTIELPPLRERGNDSIELTEFFLDKYSIKYNKTGLYLDTKTRKKILNYPWPGNIRELMHTIERVVILSDGKAISSDDLHLIHKGEGYTKNSFRLEDVEKETILNVMKKCSGNHSKASKMLAISRTTLYAKLNKYGL